MESIDSFLKELEIEDSTAAPFDLKVDESQKNRMVFLKVRAKNFRSVGSEFLELDFTKNRTTLIVSEDNGSGKSTLCVWAPYFALTGKPYSKKEKIGALVNSQTRKDMLVELYLTTRGIDYKIVRGYKPAIFDIYKKESGSWVKTETPPSSSQQQTILEDLLGFDAKILEKTMILGLDKFEPFIDLDAANRRQLIEKIWDLTIFSVMLDESKKLAAISRRKKEETSIEIDKTETALETAKQDIENANLFEDDLANLVQEIEELKVQLSDVLPTKLKTVENKYNEFSESQKSSLRKLTDTKVEVIEAIKTDYEGEGKKLTQEYEEAKALGEKLKENAESQFEGERASIQSKIDTLKTTQNEENTALLTELRAKKTKLTEMRDSAEQLAEQKASEYLDSQSSKTPLPAIKAEHDALKDKISELVAKQQEIEIKRLNLKTDLGEFQDKIKSEESKLTSVNLGADRIKQSLKQIEDSKKALAETGNCSHCLQVIGEEALELFEQSVAQRKTDLNEQLIANNTEVQSLQDKISEYTSKISGINIAISEHDKEHGVYGGEKLALEKELSLVDTKFEVERSKWESLLKSEYDRIKRETMHEAVVNLEDFTKNESITRINEIKAKHHEEMSGLKNALDTLESKINTAIAQAQEKATEAASAAKIAYNTWNDRLKAEIDSKSSHITEKIASTKDKLIEAEQRFNNESSELRRQISDLEKTLTNKQAQSSSLEIKINTLVGKGKNKLDESEKALEMLNAKHQSISDKLVVQHYLIDELGDSAAKREIIKQYIPFLNAKINEYMAAMNLFVGFSMDEKFEVSFNSPDRKTQTVHSLSNGQKTRMNLAILFALRDVANLKNTTDANLLVLDELLEPISEQGIREVVEMLRNKFNKSNIVVVTQRKNEFIEYFDNTINYGLRGGFTEEVDIQ